MRTVFALVFAFALAACSATNKNAPSPPAASDLRPAQAAPSGDGGAADSPSAATPR